MTIEQLEEYLTKLLPSFKKKYIKSADDDDLCQLAIIDLYKKHDIINASSDNEFTKLFLSFYGSWQFYKRSTIAKAIKWDNYLMPFMGDRQVSGPDKVGSYNPWETPLTQALEYLQLIDNPRVQAIMYMYYIEGYTMGEVAKVFVISDTRVDQLLQEGIKDIKRFTAANS